MTRTNPATEDLKPLRAMGFRVEVVMGMPIGIDVRDRSIAGDPEHVQAVLDQCFDVFRWVDDTFSLWRPETPMARLSAGTTSLSDVPVEVVEVLRECVVATRDTGGAFSARDPRGRLDPTGLVKGWAVARVGRLLVEAGYRDWCITAAGDVLVHGRASTNEPWVVGIAAPSSPDHLLDAVRLDLGGAVATSGNVQRGDHIWDPLNGRAAHGIVSASVHCLRETPDAIVRADILATAAVARGRGAIEWLNQLADIEALVVHDDGSVASTSGWDVRSILWEPA